MALLINTVRNAVHSYAPLMVHLNGPAEEVLEQHRALIAAIEARDPVAAAAAAEAHLRAGTSRVGELMVSSAPADETE
jgi:DNA-binding GntR family transcriptional regulator